MATDKEDYSPGETVLISGSGYATGCELKIRVTRPDGSVVLGDGTFAPGTDRVLTDAAGGFVYAYQLNGITGEYVVDALGTEDTVLASTTFLDGSIVLIPLATGRVTTTTTGAGADRITLPKPEGVTNFGDFMLVQVAVDGGEDVTITPPLGWRRVEGSRADYATDVGHELFYKFHTPGESGPYVFSLSRTVLASAGLVSYRGVDEQQPMLDVGPPTTGTGTRLVALGSVLVSPPGGANLQFFATDSRGVPSVPGNTSARFGQALDPSPSIRATQAPIPGDGVPRDRVATTNAAAAWVAQQIVLNPDRRSVADGNVHSGCTVFAVESPQFACLILPKPEDTDAGDFLLAQIGYQGGTGVQIDPPPGWTLLRRDDAVHLVGQALYSRFATATEPATYEWGLNPSAKATGGITAYAGIDPASPIGNVAWVASVSPRTRPVVGAGTTADAEGAMFVFMATADAPSAYRLEGLFRERYDRRNGTGLPTILAADIRQSGPGASGDQHATLEDPASWVSHVIALRLAPTPPGNRPPTVTVALNPSSPTTNETLTATATTGDEDGDPVTVGYRWLRNGVAIPGQTASTLDLSQPAAGNKGDLITVEATPHDGTWAGVAITASATVANSPPTASVAITPADPDTDATLTAAVTSADPDGDAVSVRYVWKKNGIVTNETTWSYPLSLDTYGDEGDEIAVEAIPHDGTVAGAAGTASVIVGGGNSAPTAIVRLSPADPTTNQTLTASTTTTDPDGDAVTVAYRWLNDGIVIAGETGTTFDLSRAGFGDKGDVITVEAVPSDGLLTGEAASASETVANSDPTVELTGDVTPREGSPALYSFAVTDPDSDLLAVTSRNCGGGEEIEFAFDAAAMQGSLRCAFADGPAPDSVSVTVSDGSAEASGALEVEIQNSAPKIALSGSSEIAEGDEYALTLGDVIDAGVDIVTEYTVRWADGTVETLTATEVSAADGILTHRFPDGPATHRVTVDLTDEDGTHSEAGALEVAVTDVAPVVTAAAAQAAEEGAAQVFELGGFLDPGDDGPWTVSVDWGDGTNDERPAMDEPGAVGGYSHSYVDDGVYTVTLTVREEGIAAASRSAQFIVAVANMAPEVTTPPEPQAGGEGAVAVELGSFVDQGTADAPWRVTVAWGDGTTTVFDAGDQGNLGPRPHLYADDGTYEIAVTVTDEDGASGSDSTTYTVRNVAPSGTLEHNGPVDEGAPILLEVVDTYDPSIADTAAGFEYAFDCGTGSGYGPFAADPTFSCSTSDSGTRTVRYLIRDVDRDASGGSSTVGIDNVAPVATFGHNGPVDEGTSVSLSLTNAFDPSTVDTQSTFRYSFTCFPTAATLAESYEAAGPADTTPCDYVDDDAYAVTGRIHDKDNGASTYTASVPVTNANPRVKIVQPWSGTQIGTATRLEVVATFTDAGTSDSHECTIIWSDGSVTYNAAVAQGSGEGTCRGSHAYLATGRYTVTVVVTDNDGGAGSASVEGISVAAMVLAIDEDSIDNGTAPNRFTTSAVNDSLARIGLRSTLPAFDGAHEMTSIYLHTGQVGDEGWFAIKTIPSNWHIAGPTPDGLQNYLHAGRGLGSGSDREKLLDKVPNVTPLRGTGLGQLVGESVCAVVYDGDISMNYGPLNGSLKGDNLGMVAFRVLGATQMSGSSLPKVQVTILDRASVCGGPLQLYGAAPTPTSSSTPFDVRP